MRWFNRLFFAFLILFVAIVAFFLTPYGFHQSITFAQRYIPGTLTYKKISGTPFGPINIVGLNYKSKEFDFSAENAHLEWQLPMLLLGKIDIIDFQASNIHILDKNQDDTTDNEKIAPPKAKKLHLPLGLIIKNASIRNIVYHHVQDKTHFNIHRIFVRRFKLTTHKINGVIGVNLKKPYLLNGNILLDGNLSNYHFICTVSKKAEKLRLVGHGDKRNAYISLNNNKLFGGSIHGNFWLHWFPKIGWNSILKISQLNLKQLDPELPLIQKASISTDGTWEHDAPDFSMSADITLPSTQIIVQGKHFHEWNLQWHVLSNDLSQLTKKSTGSINASGTILGPTLAPIIQLTLQGKNLNIGPYSAEQIEGKSTLDLSWRTPTHLELKGIEIKTPDVKLDHLALRLSGSSELKQVDAQITFSTPHTKDFTLNTQLLGALNSAMWQGKINQLTFSSKELGAWHVKSPTPLFISQQKIQLGPLCVNSNASHSCLKASWDDKNNWSLNANGNLENLNFLSNFISEYLRTNAPTHYHLSVVGTKTGIQQLNADFHSQSGSISYQRDFESVNIPFQELHLSAKTEEKKLIVNLKINPGQKDFVNTTFIIDRFTGRFVYIDTLPIRGDMQLHFSKLKIFKFFIPYIDEPTGIIEGNIKMTGSLNNPSWQGNLRLTKGTVAIPQFKLKLENLTIALQAKNHQVNYTASAKSGVQTLTAQGTSRFQEGKLLSDINIHGENILVSNTPEYTIYASPDINLKIIDHSSVLSGSILIPNALIKPADFSSTLTLPDDVIILSQKETAQTSPWAWLVNLKISLGNDIVIDTHGLKGKLKGELQITRTADQPNAVATGQLHISDAAFDARGKQLTIAPNSYIAYTHDSLNNPHLNIQAYRSVTILAQAGTPLGPTETKVGIDIKGTVRHPIVTMFSTPANLSQADILSYLLFNQPAGGSSSSQISLILQAVKSLRLSRKSEDSSISQIQQTLGITELGVQQQLYVDALGTPFGINQSAFVIGKYLTPNIYIRYNHGLVRAVDIYEIRYIINKNWAIQTEIGTTGDVGNGMDILYNISRPNFPW